MTAKQPNRNCIRVKGHASSHHGAATFSLLLLFPVVVVGSVLIINMKLRRNSMANKLPGSAMQSPKEGGNESARELYPVTINPGPPVPTIECGVVNADGTPVTVSCAVCHTTRNPDHGNRTSGDLTDFHQSVLVAHGNITCLSCHNESDYETLGLADGHAVEYRDVMQLCAQCHGQQMTDYLHGAHGGMTGYWDLSKGPRTRNNCVDCHHPHQPSFPSMQPTFKPFDRTPVGHEEGARHD